MFYVAFRGLPLSKLFEEPLDCFFFICHKSKFTLAENSHDRKYQVATDSKVEHFPLQTSWHTNE